MQLLLFLVANVRYLCIKQQALNDRLRYLTARIHTIQLKITAKQTKPRPNAARIVVANALSHLVMIRLELRRLFTEIAIANHFWSNLIGLYLTAYVTIICSLTYQVVNNAVTLDQRLFFYVIDGCFTITPFWLTRECNMIVRNNSAIFDSLWRFQLTLVRKHSLSIPTAQRIKVIGCVAKNCLRIKSCLFRFLQNTQLDTMVSNKRSMLRIAFTIFDIMRMDARIFEMVSPVCSLRHVIVVLSLDSSSCIRQHCL